MRDPNLKPVCVKAGCNKLAFDAPAHKRKGIPNMIYCWNHLGELIRTYNKNTQVREKEALQRAAMYKNRLKKKK